MSTLRTSSRTGEDRGGRVSGVGFRALASPLRSSAQIHGSPTSPPPGQPDQPGCGIGSKAHACAWHVCKPVDRLRFPCAWQTTGFGVTATNFSSVRSARKVTQCLPSFRGHAKRTLSGTAQTIVHTITRSIKSSSCACDSAGPSLTVASCCVSTTAQWSRESASRLRRSLQGCNVTKVVVLNALQKRQGMPWHLV